MKLKNFKVVEIVFLVAVILTWLMKSVLKITGFDIELVVCCSVLAIVYMFFGFKMFGRPEGGTYLFSILSGVVYAVGIISVMMNALSFGGRDYFLIPSIILLGLVGLVIFLKRRKNVTSALYWNTQLLRCFILIVLNAIYVF